MFRVTAPSAAAWVSVSYDPSRLFISPPNPFQRAIGSRNSKPARSASCDTSTISLQIAGQRSGTLVRVSPPSEFIEKTPSLNLFGPCIGWTAMETPALRSRIEHRIKTAGQDRRAIDWSEEHTSELQSH